MNTPKEELEVAASSTSTGVVKASSSFILSLNFQSLFHIVLGIESEVISKIGFEETDRKS